jgi:hypothetical protein
MRYPTRRGGLIVSPYEIGFHEPTLEEQNVRRLVTQHHGYYERARYNDVRFRSVFRNLITNVYPLLAHDHNVLHQEFDGPVVPPDTLMVEVVEDFLTMHGVITCVREKKTRSTFDIQPEDWRHIKRGYRNETGLGRRPSVQPTHIAS